MHFLVDGGNVDRLTGFILVHRRDDDWCSGRFYHLKEVCWSDPTNMFQRYRSLTRSPDSSVREPRVLAPFYDRLEGMRDLFNRVGFVFCVSIPVLSVFTALTRESRGKAVLRRCPALETKSLI